MHRMPDFREQTLDQIARGLLPVRREPFLCLRWGPVFGAGKMVKAVRISAVR